MAYAYDSKSYDRKVLWVQVPPPAPIALVFQWIGYLPPKEMMQVRFLPRAQSNKKNRTLVVRFERDQ